jgi:hypothetical protein
MGARRTGDVHNWERIGAQWSLHVRDSQIELSHVDSVDGNARQHPDRFHARRSAPPLHSGSQGFGNNGACFLACAVGQLILGVYLSFITELYKFPV